MSATASSAKDSSSGSGGGGSGGGGGGGGGGVRNRLGLGLGNFGMRASSDAARSAVASATTGGGGDCGGGDCASVTSGTSTAAMSDSFYADSYHGGGHIGGGGPRSRQQPHRTFSPTGGDAPMGTSAFTNGTLGDGVGDGRNEAGGGSTSAAAGSAKKLGTVDGVFLPCLQTILGVILFLRLTSITAQAGVLQTTLIILICVASTLLTALSLSAIATNGTICAGGPYYVISRTLGVEIGGALGLLFYLGNTVAASMYVLGAIEALASAPHFTGAGHLFPWDAQAASLLLMFLLACVVNVGVRYVNVTSNLFLGMVFLSIFCMCLGCVLFAAGTPFSGRLNPWDRVFLDNVWPSYEPDPVTEITPTFFGLLAIFYPSVTGILAGSNRSAVLADPGRSIPRGTISAIGATTSVYLFVVWLFGLTVSNRTLKTDKFVVSSVAFPNDSVVKVGVVLSCVGAALQCLAGAPRLLQAIAMDGTMPMLRGLRPKPGDDVTATPRKAVWITWFIASVPTLAGNLDHITPFVTMFYLLMYSGINLSTFFLAVIKSPGFRPTFRYFHWSVSLLGFVWCLGLALVISWYTALLALGLFSLLYLYNRRQKSQKDWGDVGDGIRYNMVTSLLRDLTGTTTEEVHAKNWRPQLLTVVDTDECGNPADLWVLSLAGQLKKGRGINMVASVVRRHPSVKKAGTGSTAVANGGSSSEGGADAASAAPTMEPSGFDDWETCELVSHCRSLLQRRMKLERMDGFAEVSATSSRSGETREAVWSAVVHSGLGPLSPNAVLLSYPSVFRRSTARSSRMGNFEEDYLSAVRGVMNLRKAVILFRGCDRYPYGTDVVHNASIDVWWIVHDGGLLLLLPFILSKNGVWGKAGARLRLFAVVTSPTENPERLRRAVEEHLTMVRISAEVHVADLSDSTVAEDMRETDGAESSNNTVLSTKDDMSKMKNTHDKTVGEVFSRQTYDVPYHAIVPTDDVDDAEYGMGPYAMNGGGGGGEGAMPRGPVDGRIDDDDIDDEEANKGNGSGRATSSTFSDNRAQQKERMETASAFNSLLRLHSADSALVVTNLPLIRRGRPSSDFFDYVDAVCDGLDNVLLVRGSGAEVITTYA